MKTAVKLFGKYANYLFNDNSKGMDKPDFIQALTEHDNEIKELIEEMKEIEGECKECGQDYKLCNCLASIDREQRNEALNKLKNNIKEQK